MSPKILAHALSNMIGAEASNTCCRDDLPRAGDFLDVDHSWAQQNCITWLPGPVPNAGFSVLKVIAAVEES